MTQPTDLPTATWHAKAIDVWIWFQALVALGREVLPDRRTHRGVRTLIRTLEPIALEMQQEEAKLLDAYAPRPGESEGDRRMRMGELQRRLGECRDERFTLDLPVVWDSVEALEETLDKVADDRERTQGLRPTFLSPVQEETLAKFVAVRSVEEGASPEPEEEKSYADTHGG